MEPDKTRIARDPRPIKLTATQVDNYLIRPEDFKVRRYNDPMEAAFHGQSENDGEAARKSNERFNTGSVRAEGDRNHAGPPHTRMAKEE